ncbi:hypothetical protein [Dyella subtropica]|uniref:hypothetical protein n=1 Tax=Dyella subtropica TaxID=2992127 RepID=UPI00225950CD|nr:hypothetical protein [Dyella subtropica]
MRVALLFAATLVVSTFSAPSPAGQAWLSAVDPVVAADRSATSHVAMTSTAADDFMELFKPEAAWSKSASSIKVFKVSTQFLHRATDQQLATVIQDLRRRHIALGLEAEILATSVQCGNGVPGYTTTAVIQKLANRVSGLGGKIEYVAFDEPMTWGHFSHGGHACGYTTEALVQNIAPNIRILKAAFPGVKFGDIEPVTDQTADRLDEIMDFAKVFHEQLGEKLTFLQADIIWQNKWQPQLVEWRKRLHATGMSYGVIIDGDPGDKTDIDWTRHAIERYRIVASDPNMKPDDFVFQSWQSRPTRILPENEPGTLTSVIHQTVAAH